MSVKQYLNGNETDTVLNKCPVCGGTLEYCNLYQISHVYRILKNGKLSKRYSKREEGSMDCGFICCSNCDFHTDCDLDTDCVTGVHIYESDFGSFRITKNGEEE